MNNIEIKHKRIPALGESTTFQDRPEWLCIETSR